MVFNKTTGLATWKSSHKTDTHLIYLNMSRYLRNPTFFHCVGYRSSLECLQS